MNETKAIRTEMGLNQREFGERLGMSQSRVAHWERGADIPDTRTLLAMRWLLHEHRRQHVSPERAPSTPAPFRDPAAVAAIFDMLGGDTVIAEGSKVPVTALEQMRERGTIASHRRTALVEFARTSGFDLDAVKLVMRPLGTGARRTAA